MGFTMPVLNSCSKFYLWEEFADGIDLIEDPTTLERIIQALKDDGFSGLVLKELETSM